MDRKRSHPDGGYDSGDRKRRASPPVDGGSRAVSSKARLRAAQAMPGDEEDGELDSLSQKVETFQKEAIYRQMREYKRQHARSSARVVELEQRKHALEAGLESVEVSWTELLAAVRNLVGDKSVPQGDKPFLSADKTDPNQSPYPTPSSSLPKLTSAVQHRSQSTKELIVKFVELAGRGVRATEQELRSKLGHEQTESTKLQSSVRLLESQLEQERVKLERSEKHLLRAEKDLDRLRCDSVQGVEQGSRPADTPVKDEPAAKAESKDASTIDQRTPQAQLKAEPSTNGNGEHLSSMPMPGPSIESQEDRLLAASRLEEINRLRDERVSLHTTLDQMRFQVEHPSDGAVAESGLFKSLMVQVSHFQAQANEAKRHFDELAAEADSLRDGRQDFEDNAIGPARAEVDSLRSQLSKKEADLARLRGQRDDLGAELSERRAGEIANYKHVDEIVALSNSHLNRIETLQSEVRRLKAKLASTAGGSDGLLDFLLSEGTASHPEGAVSYVRSLESKLQSSESRISVLADQIANSNTNTSVSSALAGESAARSALADVQRRLDAYEKVLGPDPSVGEDLARMGKQLEEKQELLRVMDLKVKENEAATDALYGEVERLSASWEDVASQANSKVLNLKEMEEKVARLSTEKAKADNKYFAAMRTKEAVEVERKTAQRQIEKQSKALEQAHLMKENDDRLLATETKRNTLLSGSSQQFQTRIVELEREGRETKVRLEAERSKTTDLTRLVSSRTSDAEGERKLQLGLQEELDKTKRELERMSAKAKIVSSGAASTGKEVELQDERNKLMCILQCSTCSLRLRSQCITRCMHTFCKECIDARIATRQRKCPACNLGFAVSDVQQIFFQ